MTSKTFGLTKNGTYIVCKAKPENRGKGNCPHEEHKEFSIEELKAGVLSRYNEKVLAERNAYLQGVSKVRLMRDGGRVPSKKEFREAVEAAAEEFSTRDFTVIKEFYAEYQRIIGPNDKIFELQEENAQRLEAFMKSDDERAVNLRNYLGDEIDIKELSHIILKEVGAMTAAVTWGAGSKSSVSRALLSGLNNDMTKERYIASVLYFGGRCCYCDRPLTKATKGSAIATGEHITPVNPDSPNEVRGSTRYGNMALACRRCNTSRGNHPLEKWIQETPKIRREDKGAVLARIQAFRKFAMYQDYTLEESQIITEKIKEINDEVISLKDKGGLFIIPISEAEERIRSKIKIAIYDLQHGLKS